MTPLADHVLAVLGFDGKPQTLGNVSDGLRARWGVYAPPDRLEETLTALLHEGKVERTYHAKYGARWRAPRNPAPSETVAGSGL